jgi:hypothetical protein|tara:strand:+ start:1337 stop:1495 length:159 start_codon:yes stop_codon:yes gene_type:complete
MKGQMNDTIQVVVANTAGIGVSLSQVNELLTFVSLSLAIMFTIYKYVKIKNK